MADEAELQPVAAGLTRGEFLEALSGLESKLTSLLQPLTTQIKELTDSIAHVTKTADSAYEISAGLEKEVAVLQEKDQWTTDKILSLENQLKNMNLKIRGVPEQRRKDKDLSVTMAEWIACQIPIPGPHHSFLTSAYRIGQPRKDPDRNPRDILLKFADSNVRFKLLSAARKTGHLLFEDRKVLLFQDLTTETLQLRKELQPITGALRKAGVRYCWISYYKLQVTQGETVYVAASLDQGLELLRNLNIELPPDSAALVAKRPRSPH